MAKIKDYVFTFEPGHHDKKHKSLGKFYTIVHAENESKARSKMYERRGIRWCACYKSAEEAGVNEHGLKFLDFNDLTKQEGPNK